MKHLLSSWKQIDAKVKKNDHIFLFLDYDGTLTPIVSKPDRARLAGDVRKILTSLSREKSLTIGVLSGRNLKEVKRLVKVKKIYYGGNHGLEIEGPGIKFSHMKFNLYRPYLKEIAKKLFIETKIIPGVLIEDKGWTLSLHYRQVKGSKILLLRNIFENVCRPYRKKKKIVITEGKKVFEVRPLILWHKGKAVRLIRKQAGRSSRGVAFYLGDDRTDEDAFKILGREDISVYIGRKNNSSSANYFLKDTGEVKKFLYKLKEIV